MVKPCDICLEKECRAAGGVGSCNCKKCKVQKECNKKLSPTIRITLKCTQSCTHCCYSCSPKQEHHMTVSTAKVIADFLKSNSVFSVNLMGGEIFCNPNWREILELIIPSVPAVRIVSNGDWAVDEPTFAEFLTNFNNCYVSLSKDQWHTNANVELAAKLLDENHIINKTSELQESESGLVPVGRAEFSFSIYSMMGCYCHNPQHHYSFLIDEIGNIFKCGFGVWQYANVFKYANGGFAERFKDFNKAFYDTFIPNCKRCISAYHDLVELYKDGIFVRTIKMNQCKFK